MDDYSANAPGVWLAQNDPSLDGRANDPSIPTNQTQDPGATEYSSDAPGGDYENGVIPTGAASPGAESADQAQGAVVDPGVPPTGQSSPDQPIMDSATTPPPPSYGGDGGSGTPGGEQPLSDPGMTGQENSYPNTLPGDSGSATQPGGDGQMASTGMPEGLSTSFEPPLGLLPIIVFGLATVIGLVIYLSRRGKNWAEISDSMRDDGGGVSQPESRIVTQFSEIHDMKGTKHPQSSIQVSGFE